MHVTDYVKRLPTGKRDALKRLVNDPEYRDIANRRGTPQSMDKLRQKLRYHQVPLSLYANDAALSTLCKTIMNF